ncbi:MAG: hypothetical protein J3Q66DRAFT_352325 [Benniella sp.]|nr:MAG: hypothetical protein J3Q66DRAFT_352325 [Benniella sp.]
MRQVTALQAPHLSFKPRLMDLLRPHFSKLQTLDVHETVGFTSAMAQEVMSSCSFLTTFKGSPLMLPILSMENLRVCLKLRVLLLEFRFDPSTMGHVQPLVLDQLSKLSRLEELQVFSRRQCQPEFEAFDLRLEYGLGKLSTLRLLRTFSFGVSKQKMREQEVDWILDHWKSLDRIKGEINCTLKEQLKQHGVSNKRHTSE